MIEAFKKMVGNYKDFSGKTTRGDYWWAQLGYFVFDLVLSLVAGILVALSVAAADSNSGALSVVGWLLIVFIGLGFLAVNVFLAIADISMSVRRLRDAGFPWWCIFVNFVPSVGNVAYLVFLCFPSSDTPVINFGNETQNSGNSANTYSAPVYTASSENTYKAPDPAPAAPVVDVSPEEAPVVGDTAADVGAETKSETEARPKIIEDTWVCPSCGMKNDGKFCPVCGTKRP